MKNRLESRISEAVRRREKLFCAFLTLGYPSVSATGKLILAFEKEGVDMIELGFPFSDPMADGPTIQFSSERALKNHVAIRDAFRLVRKLRRANCRLPFVFFGYLNPIYHYGIKKFVRDAKQAGFDGLIIPDLPPGSEPGFEAACRRRGLSQIFFIAPTTDKKRAAFVSAHSRGFIYYVSIRGVTGSRRNLPNDISGHLGRMRRIVSMPFLIGFGVSGPDQARRLSRMSEGVIVGSAIIDRLRQAGGRTGPCVRFVRRMVKSVKGVR